jgi:methionyl-tRNA synthetase
VSAGKPWYITTAIDYANGPPHMGHAFEKIGADAMARYRRQCGDAVHFVMGMDEHGVKVQQAAQAMAITPQEWVDGMAEKFSSLWTRLHISHDDFIRTTQPRHARAATELVRRIRAAGDLFPGSYEGHYCVGCEAFKRDDELIRADDGSVRCPIHPNRILEWTEEKNWFFRLSAYRDRLLAHYAAHPQFVQPASRSNEVRRLVEGGLEDISLSRAGVTWGIPFPDEAGHVIYVWAEALINYVSATGFPEDSYTRLWPADMHVIGKDITRFHCVIWPAMLMSANLPLPRAVWGHGFVNFSGRKLSKSEGVKVDIGEAVDRWGPDALRYYLLRDMPWNDDGDFTWDRFDARYTADLADDLGNLANRTIAMIERYRGGTVPAGPATGLNGPITRALERYRQAMDAHLLHLGAAAAMDVAVAANGYVEERAPWSQAKDPAQAAALDETLASLAHGLAALAVMLEPFMPEKSRALAERIGLERPPSLAGLADLQLAGRPVHRGEVLFAKERDDSA